MIPSSIIFVLFLLNGVIQTTDAQDVTTYKGDCTGEKRCTFPGTTCKAEASGATTFKCLCDTTKHFKTNENDNGCVCNTGYTGTDTCLASLGTACTTTADCEKTTETGAVCDILAGNKICALESTATCTGKETKCVSNAACTGVACACSAGFVANTAKLCVAKIETTCAKDTNCVVNAYCSSGLKCACKPQYTATEDKTSCTAIALGGGCTATGGECASLANAYCNTVPTSAVCACATVFPVSGSTCTAKSCSSGVAACTDVDPNSVCESNACKCKANYGIFSRGTKALCQPGVGATCSANGGECGNLTGGYCNTAVCACGAIYDVSTTSCNPKPCDRGSTTCATADANSECGPGYCVCKSGMSIGSAGKCVSANPIPDSGAEGLLVSMVTLIGCLLISKLE